MQVLQSQQQARQDNDICAAVNSKKVNTGKPHLFYQMAEVQKVSVSWSVQGQSSKRGEGQQCQSDVTGETVRHRAQ